MQDWLQHINILLLPALSRNLQYNACCFRAAAAMMMR
jgi:hypothetical protein